MDRVQRSHRFLEDHRNPVSPDLLHFLFADSQQIFSLEKISPCAFAPDAGSRRITEREVTLFPLPDSPTMPKTSLRARLNERSEITRTCPSPLEKIYIQVAHFQQIVQ
jgi:hypothetical protein